MRSHTGEAWAASIQVAGTPSWRAAARQVLLHHHGDGAAVIEGFDDGAEVQAVSRHAEDAHAAHAVQRFENDVAVFCVKGADGFGRSRDERGRDVLRPLHDGELFGVVAQGARAVDDARALALGLL